MLFRSAQGPPGPIGPSHAYSASCLLPSCAAIAIVSVSSYTTVLSLSLPAGLYVVTAKTSIQPTGGVGSVTCQLVLETAGTVLDVSNGSALSDVITYFGEPYSAPSVVSAISTVALSSPDTVLCQCAGVASNAQNSQLVATLVGAIN